MDGRASHPYTDNGYDAWGNLHTISLPSGYSSCLQPDNLSLGFTNNRVTNSGFAYDADGDMTADGTNTYTYNGGWLAL